MSIGILKLNRIFMLNLEEIQNLDIKKLEILDRSFFVRNDIQQIARQLLGKLLITNTNEGLSGGIICETEGYFGSIDLACHAHKNKITKRNAALYREGGILYVHTCRGHVMLNVVTNKESIPHGILIRGIVPIIGIDLMRKRRGFIKDSMLANGPGKLTKALGITMKHNMLKICKDKFDIFLELPEICILDLNLYIDKKMIKQTPRIGVDYAKAWANIPLRFVILPQLFHKIQF
ncbi:MAG: DNA-3-methyladenine glycosylase [Desulfurella sp.]|uniref:DNA-3-methyladenine glycosylase n=1 Tax=Desulfurella sp. TaxID=1962857 RepID=UPI003D0B177A